MTEIRIEHGQPTAEELAAVVAVVTALASTESGGSNAKQQRSAWGDPARLVRSAHAPGPDAWRLSARSG